MTQPTGELAGLVKEYDALATRLAGVESRESELRYEVKRIIDVMQQEQDTGRHVMSGYLALLRRALAGNAE